MKSKPFSGFKGSLNATLNVFLTLSAKPIQAPELAAIYRRGIPCSRAYSDASLNTTSSSVSSETSSLECDVVSNENHLATFRIFDGLHSHQPCHHAYIIRPCPTIDLNKLKQAIEIKINRPEGATTGSLSPPSWHFGIRPKRQSRRDTHHGH
jgi:hypothetical protein